LFHNKQYTVLIDGIAYVMVSYIFSD